MAHMPARVTRAFYAEASGDLGLSGLGDTVNVAEKKRHFDEVLTTNATLAPLRLYDQLSPGREGVGILKLFLVSGDFGPA
jgi:hypothetical protein